MTFMEALAAAKMTQAEVAKLIGVGQPTVSRLCARTYQPSLKVAEKIIRVFGGKVTLAELTKRPRR